MNESTVQLREAKTLPDGWRWVKLGEVCDDTETRDPTISPETLFQYIDISGVDATTKRILSARTILGKDAPSRARQVVKADDILVATTRPNLNAVAIVPTELDDEICSTGFCVLRPAREIDPFFLFFFVQTNDFVRLVSGEVRGMLYPAITDSQVRAISIPLPPLPEQQRIAARIQELMAEVEHARTACETQLEAAKTLPQAYLRQVFESEEAKKWERRRLGEVCSADSGVWGDPSDGSPNCFPILRSNNIQNGTIVFDDVAVRKIGEPSTPDKKCLATGDILVTTSSGSKDLLGKGALFVQASDGQKYLFSNFTMRLRLNKEIVEPTFLYFYLQSPRAKRVLALLQDTTTGLRNLDRTEFLAQTVPVPLLTQQQRIASELKEKIAQAEKLKQAIEKQLEAIKTLPQAILRKAFRGEL